MRQGLIVGTNGSSMRWYKDDLYHRDDGPAVIIDGDCWWYKNGKRHREDGPAVEYPNGSKNWHFYGNLINVSSQEEFERWLKFKSFL